MKVIEEKEERQFVPVHLIMENKEELSMVEAVMCEYVVSHPRDIQGSLLQIHIELDNLCYKYKWAVLTNTQELMVIYREGNIPLSPFLSNEIILGESKSR